MRNKGFHYRLIQPQSLSVTSLYYMPGGQRSNKVKVMQVKPDLIISLSLPSQFYYDYCKMWKEDTVHEKDEVR